MTPELLKLRWQVAKGTMLEAWGGLTNNYADQLTGRRLRLAGEMQYSMTISRRLMDARRKQATAMTTAPRS